MIKEIIFLLFILILLQCGCKKSTSTKSIEEINFKNFNIVFTSVVNGRTDIYTIKSDGSNLKKVVQMPDIYYAPQWTYEGSQIVFVKENNPNYDFYIIDSSGSNLQKIGEGQQFICSPFENKICYISQIDSSWNNVFVIWEVFSMNMDGSNIIKLTDTKYQKFGPLWSSQDSIITYTLNDNVNGTGESIYKLNVHNGSSQILVQGYDSPLISDWSDINNSVLFSAEHADIFKLNLITGNITQLTNEIGRDEGAIFSPTGNKIVFESGRNQNTQIYTMNPDGSNVQNLSNSIDHDYFPQWSPDGTLIAYISYSNENVSKIRIMSQNGDGNKLLTETEGYHTGFDWY